MGTTNSCVFVMGKTARVIENAKGNRTTPSVVTFNKHSERLVGLPAKRQAAVDAHNTVFGFKHLVGRQFKDKDVKQDMEHCLLADLTDDQRFKMASRSNTPQKSCHQWF